MNFILEELNLVDFDFILKIFIFSVLIFKVKFSIYFLRNALKCIIHYKNKLQKLIRAYNNITNSFFINIAEYYQEKFDS